MKKLTLLVYRNIPIIRWLRCSSRGTRFWFLGYATFFVGRSHYCYNVVSSCTLLNVLPGLLAELGALHNSLLFKPIKSIRNVRALHLCLPFLGNSFVLSDFAGAVLSPAKTSITNSTCVTYHFA